MCTKLYKILAISILALLAASCQKEELQPQGEGFTATAVICESVATKVDYNTDEEANVVTQQWALNDVVFGFDNLGQTFTFKVTSINENSGKATFSLNGYEPGNATKAYAVFYPGKSGFNADGTLDVDLTSQNGILSTETPVLMCATAEIKGNKVEFNFTNQTAVIEVKKFQIEPGKTVNSLEIGGLVATGRFMVENGEMILVPDADPSTITANVNLTADGEGIVDTPVYFAALATRDAHITVAANAGGKRYDNANAVPVTNVEAGHLYYMSKKLAQVAKVGNATYSTLAEAVAACAASHKKQTITILRDFTETTLIKISDKGIVLDLSGHDAEARIEVSSELELEDSGEGGTLRYTDANVIKVNAGGKLTMNGGMVKAEYVGTKRSAISILGSTDKKAEAVFNGGTVTGNNYRGALECQYAKVDINGGTFNGYTPITVWRYSDVTINDAHVECTQPSEFHGECIYFCTEYITTSGSNKGSMENVNVVINGGEFIANEGPMFVHSNGTDVSENAILEIRGGYFTRPDDKSLFSAGTLKNIDYSISGGAFSHQEFDNFFKDGDGDWFIPCKFSCDDKGFPTLEDAFAEAQSKTTPAVVKMFCDWTMKGTANLSSKDCTFDMQGHNLTVNKQRINVTGGYLKITSSGKNATFNQATDGFYLMNITNGGTVTTDKVDFSNTATSAAFMISSGNLIMNGGSIKGSKAYYTISANNGSSVKITGGEVSAASATAISVSNSTFNMTGGKLTNITDSDENPAIRITGGASATISNGGIKSEGSHAIAVNGSTLSISDGTFTSTSNNAVNCNANSHVTIENGTFNSETTTVYVNNSEVTILDGSLESKNLNAVTSANKAVVTIEGGTFKTVDHATVYVNNANTTMNNGDFYSKTHLAVSCEDNAEAIVHGGTYLTEKGTTLYLMGSKVTVDGGLFTSSESHAIHCEAKTDETTGEVIKESTAIISGGTFISNASSSNAKASGHFTNSAVTISGGEISSTNNAALSIASCSATPTSITGGTFSSTSGPGISVNGSDVSISGNASFSSDSNYALSGINGANITFDGGSFESNKSSALSFADDVTPVINNGTFKSTAGTALTVNGRTITIGGGQFQSVTSNALYCTGNANVNIEDGTFTSTSGNAVRCESGADVSITSGSFNSGSTVIFSKNAGTTVTINNGSFKSTGSSTYAVYAGNDAEVTVCNGVFNTVGRTLYFYKSKGDIIGGTFKSTDNYALYLTSDSNVNAGSVVTISGGSFISDNATSVYLYGSLPHTLSINGGNFICNNSQKYDSGYANYCYALYAGGSNHIVTITNTTSEPYFYTESTDVSAAVSSNSANTVSITAGYLNKNKVGTSSTSLLDGNHQIVPLSPAKTLTVDGKNYSFGWQLISK